jgi:hypothetical protein
MAYNITINPLFVKDGKEYPFEGGKGNSIEYRFIIKTLRKYFGDDVEIKKEIDGRTITLAFLTADELEILRHINEYTDEIPIKYGRSNLKFAIDDYKNNGPSCDGRTDCECSECMCQCKGCKY